MSNSCFYKKSSSIAILGGVAMPLMLRFAIFIDIRHRESY